MHINTWRQIVSLMNCISQTRENLREIIKHQPNALLFSRLMLNKALVLNNLLKATLLAPADFSHFCQPSALWHKWLLLTPPWVPRARVSVCLLGILSQQQLLRASDSHRSVGEENCFQWVSTVSNQPRPLQTPKRDIETCPVPATTDV